MLVVALASLLLLENECEDGSLETGDLEDSIASNSARHQKKTT